MAKIFFDLDGTLINSKNRLYVLFQTLVPQSTFSYDDYWALKHQKINHQQILLTYFPQVDFDMFNQKWLAQIETKEMLDLDFLYKDAISVLTNLKQKHELFVLTARQNKDNLLYELKKLGIFDYFNDVFLTEHKKNKDELIAHLNLSPDDILIGDTGYDIDIAKSCNIKSIAITHGFLPVNILKEYKPDVLIDNLGEIIQ